MKPDARPFYRSAIDAMEHARGHVSKPSALDTTQVVLSLDYAAEMILKAAVLEQGKSVMQQSGRSLSLPAALRAAGPYANGSTIELLHERRNGLQHIAGSVDVATSQEAYEGVIPFIEEVLRTEFNLPLPAGLQLSAKPIAASPQSEAVWLTERLQRDIYAFDGVAVWSQGVAGSNALGCSCNLKPLGRDDASPRSQNLSTCHGLMVTSSSRRGNQEALCSTTSRDRKGESFRAMAPRPPSGMDSWPLKDLTSKMAWVGVCGSTH